MGNNSCKTEHFKNSHNDCEYFFYLHPFRSIMYNMLQSMPYVQYAANEKNRFLH